MILAPTLTLSAGSGAAIVRPTFSRDFAGEKTLNNGTGPAITFTRASNATFFNASGVLTTASNDQPRFDHDPATGASRGLLIEESRQNLLERSAEFDNAYWTKTETSVTANSLTAPDGTLSAEKLVDTTNNAVHALRRTPHTATTEPRTLSVFAKKGERDRLAVALWNGSTAIRAANAVFDLTNGTVLFTYNQGTWTNVSASITALPDGWFRCTVTGTGDGVGYGIHFALAPSTQSAATHSTGADSYTGDGTSGLYIWGAQLEAGAFPTSYIPTTTAAATRSADSAVVTPISSFYNQAEGTILAEGAYANAASSVNVGNRVLVQFDAGNPSDNFISLFNLGSGHGAGVGSIRSNGVTQAVLGVGSTTVPVNVVTKYGIAYKSNDFIGAKDGTLSAADTSGAAPSVDRLSIGTLGTATSTNMFIRKIAYWPKRLSNTLLQQLTT